MKVALMAARSRNDCIGRDNHLPWYLPGDLQYFKQVTQGKPVIMGRRTWESLKGALPKRLNIVITRQVEYRAEGAKVVASLDDAVSSATQWSREQAVDEIVVIGGAEIFRAALPDADRVYMTEVQAEIDGDTFFPKLATDQWRMTWHEDHKAEPPNEYDYRFALYERKVSESL